MLLYELLTGATPFDRQRLKEVSYDELRRIIQEEEPPRPSARLSTLDAALDTVAEKHQTDLRTLSRRLSGELDWIVMRALEKDRNRRYESASAFGRDVERYLNDQPVAACPPSLSYQFRKFARRNRVAFTTSAVVAVAVLAGTGVSVWQAHRATNEARRATLAEQLAGRRLEQVDEQRRIAEDNYNEAETQRRRAEANVQLAMDALDQVYLPLVEAEFSQKTELDEQGRGFLEKTLPFYETLAAQKADDPQAQFAKAQAYLRVGNIYRTLRARPEEKEEQAEKALRQAITLFKELTAQPSDKPEYYRGLANSYRDLGDLLYERQPEEAEQAYWRSIAVYKTVVNDLPWYQRHEFALVHYNLGVRLVSRWGRPKEAVQVFRKNLTYTEQLLAEFPDSHTHRQRVAAALSALGGAYHSAGQTRQAEEFMCKAIDRCEHWAAEFPEQPGYPLVLGRALTRLAALLQGSDRLDEAEQTYFRSRDVMEDLVQRWPGPTWYRNALGAGTLPDLATLLESRRRFDEAETAWSRALALNEQLAVELPYSGHPRLANKYRMNLIRVLMELGRDEQAEKIISEAYPAPGTAEELAHRAELYETAHQSDKALADYSRALELEPNSDCYVSRAKIYSEQKEYDKALADYERALELEPQRPLDVYRALSDLYIARGQWQQALVNLNKEISITPSEWWRYKRRATAFFYLEQYDKALADIAQAVELNPSDFSNLTWVSATLVARCPDENFRKGLLELADRTLELTDGSPGAYVTRGYLKARLDNLDDALADYERGIEATEDPGLRAQHYNNAAWYLATSPGSTPRHVEKAIQWVEKAIELEDSTDAPASLYQGFQASNLMRFLPSTDPYFARGSLYAALEMDDRAQADFEEYIKRLSKPVQETPDDWSGWNRRGVGYCNLGRHEEAIADFSKAIELEADEPIVWANRGWNYAKLGRWSEAAADYAKAIELGGASHSNRYQYAMLCLASQNPDGYAKACTGMLDRFAQSDDALEMYSAAWTCALAPDAVDDYSPVIDLARRAVEVDPAFAHRPCLGAVLYRADHFEEATEILTSLAESEQPEAVSPAYGWYFLAMTHHHLGNDGPAREFLDRANQQAERELNDADGPAPWNRGLTLELLRKEAEDLLNGAQPESPSEEAPVPDEQNTPRDPTQHGPRGDDR